MGFRIYCLIGAVFLLLGPGGPHIAQGRVITEEVSTWRPAEAPVDTVFSLDGRRVFLLTGQGEVLIYTVDGRLEERLRVAKGFDRLAISPRGDLLHLISSRAKMVRTLRLDFVVEIDTANAPFMGSAGAPVQIVVFSDFECPHCGQLGDLFEQVLEKYPETVKVVFKNFPLGFHKFARPAALAGLAAQNQGRFWEYHDRLFGQGAGGLDHQKLVEIAAQLGLDLSRFTKDLASGDTARRLEQDILAGHQAGVTGTPTIFVNGRRLKARAMEDFDRIISEELSRAAGGAEGGNAN